MYEKKKTEKTLVRQKYNKKSSKFHKFIDFGLKQKLRLWILTPLFIGIILTVAISFTIVIFVEPTWFSRTGAEIVQNQHNTMQSLTFTISDYMREYMQRIINELLFIDDFTKDVLIKDPYNYNKNTVSQPINLLLTYTNATETYFNKHPLGNLGFFSWYLDENTYDEVQITNEVTLQNLIFAKNTEIVIRPLYRNAQRIFNYENKAGYASIYHIFDEDELMYYYPCPKSTEPLNLSSFEMNYACLNAKNKTFSITCFQFYLDSKILAEQNQTFLNIKTPYISNTPKNLSANVFDNDVNFAITICNSIMNSTNSSKLLMQTCIDANVTDLKLFLMDSTPMQLGELTILGKNKGNFMGNVLLRRNLSLTTFGNISENSLIQIEFNKPEDSQDEEVLAFKEMFEASYSNDEPNVGIYKKDGKNMGLIDGYFFNKVFTIGENELLANLEIVKNDINSRLLTQLLIIGAVIFVILIISLQTINYIANSIISPMDHLVMKVRKLQDGDDEVDIIENFVEKSYEINGLYFTFSKLANVLKYANKAFFEGNDAEALIRYAQALKLFSDLNNRKAMASIYNNIGNIHLMGERYEEAIENYRLSVEITEDELKKMTKINKVKYPKESNENKRILKNNKRESRKDDSGNARYSNLKHSLKNESKNSNSVSGSLIDIKGSTIGIQSTSEKKSIFETQIANRQYQLVNALIIQAEKQRVNNWEEITKRLNKVLRTDIDHRTNASRIVKAHLLISNAFLEIGDFKKSAQHINSAEEKLREYTNMFTKGLLDETEIPPDILHQKVFLQKGMLLKKIGRIRGAAEKFTNCLEFGNIYDPEIRRKCLEQLKEIFESNGLLDQIPNIPKLLENTVSKKNKDIVFALDYSESMTQPGRLKHATKAIVTIYDDYIKDNDRVGFIRFNKNVDMIFGLSDRGKNRVYLRKCLQNVEEVIKPHGETAFFTAIKESLKLHKKAEKRDHSRWIVALTDGEDNASRIKYEEIYKRLKNSDINLIIVGLALDEKIIPLLRELCLATPEGVFIETPVSKDLDIAFQSITDIIYGTSDIIVESWS